MVFKEGNIFTTVWQNPPVSLPIKFYFFNLENPDEFQNGAKPRMREMGPYVYNVWLKNEISEWGPNQESLKYFISLRWEFNEESTVGSRSDKLTFLNPVSFGTGGLVQNVLDKIPFSFTVKPIVFGFINAWLYAHGEGFVKEVTVGGFMEGEYMSMVGTADWLIKPLRWLDLDILRPLIDMFDMRLSEKKFGVLRAVNNTREGPFEIWSGQSYPRMFFRVKSFGGKTVLNHWDDPKCNMMNGNSRTIT